MTTAPSLADFLQLFGHVCLMSLCAVGGALTTLPELRRVLVGEMSLLTDAQFHASIAIAQASPGPNMLFLAVMGYQAAGIAGALVMLVAFLLPSTVISYASLSFVHLARGHRAGRAFKAGMAPLVIALMLSSGWVLGTEIPGWTRLAAMGTAAFLTVATRTHVLALVAAGAAAGALGWM